ncbi:MAG: hypothetical protein M3O31_02825 [Acidobacteriota bacterium]|nr:hypothetical protein [Acidobacteriota bacterium]
MSGKTTANDITEDAKFLFIGTVQKLDASTLTQVPKNVPTAIVHVDEVLHAPPVLAKTLGKQITVKLAKGTKPKVGEQILFHANGWLFGDTVAVESVKQEKPSLTKTMLAERVSASDPARNLADRELQNRVADADMVVEGEVSSIHLPQTESFVATRTPSSAKPVSEHDPQWREAVINVGAVHRGDPQTKQVVVRFPSSTDVQWYRAPKFRTGDRGVWLLHSSKEAFAAGKPAKRTATSELTMASPAPGATVYTALSPMDFQPASKLHTVAPVIRTAVDDSFAITRERIRQVEAKALRKLRHPSRSRTLQAETVKNS